MAREVSSSHSIFKLLCLLFADSCDVDEPDPESFSWESRMLHHNRWLGLCMLLALVNAALGVSFHIFETWEAADPVSAAGICQGGYLQGSPQGWPPWGGEHLLAV